MLWFAGLLIGSRDNNDDDEDDDDDNDKRKKEKSKPKQKITLYSYWGLLDKYWWNLLQKTVVKS